MKRRDFLKQSAAGSISLAFLPSLSLSQSALHMGTVNGTMSARIADLVKAFESVPSTKPYTYWYWMNNHVSKEGITLDLEAMKRVGVGGFLLYQVGEEYLPTGPAVYGSAANKALVDHAMREAERLGLLFVVHNCPGWSSSGGPWITPELSAKLITWSELEVAGGRAVDTKLSQPESRLNYYHDAVVLAFPNPNTDKRIAFWRDKANFVRNDTRARLPPQPEPIAQASDPVIDPTTVLDLTDKMDSQGNLHWSAPNGSWIILRLGYTTSGHTNAPGPTGGIGLECDKLSKSGIDFHFHHFFNEKFLASMQPLIERGVAGAEIDSYEGGMQNWTENFPWEFKSRTGYDLRPYLPAMTGRVVANLDISERFLWDVRKVQARMMNDNYHARFAELCRQQGIKSFIEPYTPQIFDEMAAGSHVDFPMGEFWQGTNHHSVKMAASVGHVNGRRVIAAESFTGQSRLTECPYTFKAIGDFANTQGINQFFFHVNAMQPHPTAVPGLSMGPYGTDFHRNNTWYERCGPYMEYLARVQLVLQQGHFVADVAYFAGEDSPVKTPLQADLNPEPRWPGYPNLDPPRPQGYDFDNIDPDTIFKRVVIRNGDIVLPDGMSYRIFVLPPRKTITIDLLRGICELVRQGMRLVVAGPKPEHTPGLASYPSCESELQKLTSDLWGDLDGTTQTEHSFGKGRVYWEPLPVVLEKLGVKPDFEYSSRSGEPCIFATHRQLEDADVYFIANRSHQAQDLVCNFRVAGRQPEIWDAIAGHIGNAIMLHAADGITSVPLQLEPSGSLFVVFRTLVSPAKSVESVTKNGLALIAARSFETSQKPRGVTPIPAMGPAASNLPEPVPPPDLQLLSAEESVLLWQNGVYIASFQDGTKISATIATIAPPATVSGPWHVAFPAGRGAPVAITMEKLASLSSHSDDGVRYFSGTATYSRQLYVPVEFIAAAKRVFLDLGKVQALAEVTVNGMNLGILWKPPFRIDITEAVRAGDNLLRIQVTNTWPNRLIGDERLHPDEIDYKQDGPERGAIVSLPAWYDQNEPKPEGGRVTFTTWRHWTSKSPLQESGLIGPVVLRSAIMVRIDELNKASL